MELILTIILVLFALFILSSSFRAWILSLVLRRLQRKLAEQMQRQAGGYQAQGASGQHQQASEGQAEARQGRPSPHGKVSLEEIEARKFDKTNESEYVDFEEV